MPYDPFPQDQDEERCDPEQDHDSFVETITKTLESITGAMEQFTTLLSILEQEQIKQGVRISKLEQRLEADDDYRREQNER